SEATTSRSIVTDEPLRGSLAPSILPSMNTPSDPQELTVRLIAIDSTSGRETDVVAWLDRYLGERGWKTWRIPVTPGRDDLFATVAENPLVTLSTHLDTVPPYIAPRVTADTIHGRGACDAKGIAASMICAAEGLRDRG